MNKAQATNPKEVPMAAIDDVIQLAMNDLFNGLIIEEEVVARIRAAIAAALDGLDHYRGLVDIVYVRRALLGTEEEAS